MAGSDAAGVRASLAKLPAVEQVLAGSEEVLSDWLEGRALPEGASEAVRRVARRSLIDDGLRSTELEPELERLLRGVGSLEGAGT